MLPMYIVTEVVIIFDILLETLLFVPSAGHSKFCRSDSAGGGGGGGGWGGGG